MAIEHRRRPSLKRVNVNFAPGAYASLEELAERKGISLSDVLREAISLEKFVSDTQEQGGRFLIERTDGRVTELVRAR